MGLADTYPDSDELRSELFTPSAVDLPSDGGTSDRADSDAADDAFDAAVESQFQVPADAADAFVRGRLVECGIVGLLHPRFSCGLLHPEAGPPHHRWEDWKAPPSYGTWNGGAQAVADKWEMVIGMCRCFLLDMGADSPCYVDLFKHGPPSQDCLVLRTPKCTGSEHSWDFS